MKTFSRIFLFGSVAYAFGVLLFVAQSQVTEVKANITNTNVVISQVQIKGIVADDEFIELYNPTANPIDMTGWRLTRTTASGTTQSNLVSSISGTIAPFSYFLISPDNSFASASADQLYSTSSRVADDNTVTLYSDAGITVVDKVGFEDAQDRETAAVISNPAASESAVRKASAASDASSVSPGGAEATDGNSFDTDINSTDFVIVSLSFPRNSQSPAAITPTTTQTPTEMPTPTDMITPTIEPSPTVEPTEAPTPTLEPTEEPTPTISPTDIPSPTVEPTNMPTPTNQPTGTPTPTLTPSPTPRIIVDEPLSPKRRLVCYETTKSISIMGMTFSFPQFHCKVIKE